MQSMYSSNWLESIEPKRNRLRFYILSISQTLWGSWALYREWGRIDQKVRGVRMDDCASQEEALQRAAEIIELRMRHKYVIKNH